MGKVLDHSPRVLGGLTLLLLLAFEGVLHYAPFSGWRVPLGLVLFFIPGLAFAQALLGEKGGAGEKLILSLTLPPVLYTLALYILTFYFHRPFWPSLHLLLIAISLLAAVKLFWGEPTPWGRAEIGKSEALFFLFLVLVSLLALIPHYPLVHIGSEGAYYTSLSYLIQKDIIPPYNTLLHGASVGTYWLYFLYLSIISALTGFSPPQASLVSNVYSLLVLFLILYAMARRLYTQASALWSACLMAFFGVNLWGYLFFLGRTAFHASDSPGVATDKVLLLNLYVKRALPPFVEFPPLIGLYYKFLLYNGFPMGLVYLGLMLWSTHLLLSGEKKKAVIFSSLGALGALQFHPPTAFMHLTFILAALGALWFYSRIRGQGFSFLWILYLLLPFVIGMMIHLPYLQEIGSARPDKFFEVRFRGKDFLRQFMLLGPIILFFAVGAWNSLKRVKGPELFCLAYALLALGAAIFIRLPYIVHYKFSYMAALGMGLVAGSCLEELKSITWRRVIFGFLLLSAIANMVILDFFLYRSSQLQPMQFTSRKGLVVFENPQEPMSAACNWIRENTNKRAVFLKYPLPQFPLPEFLTIPMVAQRGLYMTDFVFFTQGLKGFEEKKAFGKHLLEPQARGKETVLRQLAQIPEPFYILLERSSRQAAPHYEQLSWEFENLYASWLKKVYDRGGVKIYHLQKAS